MHKYLIRYNKTKGAPGRGTEDHAWRVFEDGKEFIVKHVKINVPSFSERSGEEWNIACNGFMHVERETSTAIIEAVPS